MSKVNKEREFDISLDKRTKLKIAILVGVIFLTAIGGITYAYFGLIITGNEEASSMGMTTANMSLVYNDVQIVSGPKTRPGWTETKTLTVTNNGDETVDYIIKWREVLNTVINGELVISATCSASSGTCDDLPEIAVPTASTEITNAYAYGPISIGVGVTQTYTLTAEFKDTGSRQNYNQNKRFYGTLNIGNGASTDEDCFTTSDLTSSTVTITGYTCDYTDIIIPTTIDNKTVTEIYGTTVSNAAFYNKGLTSVVLPNTVTSVGISAFDTNNLSSIVIPNSVTTIGESAFGYNPITSVVLPSGLTTISEGLFYEDPLESVVIPNGVTTIETDAFYINQLTSVIIPNSVTSIGNFAFEENQITSLILGNSVQTIGNFAFSENQLTSVTIPNSVTSIGPYAFYENYITSVTIPSSVMTIGNQAFYGTDAAHKKLTSVRIEGKSSTSDFTGGYGTNVFGWASAGNRTCTVTDNTSNVEGGCITWLGSS